MEEKKTTLSPKFSFLMGLFAGLAVIGIASLVVALILVNKSSSDTKGLAANNNQQVTGGQNETTVTATPAATSNVTTIPVTLGNTLKAKAGAVICKEGGKPVVYLFSTTWCPHCQWIGNTFDAMAKKYISEGKIVAYHWELDTGDNTLTPEVETSVPDVANAVYKEFNPDGSIPTFVFGCKYSRVGNGYEAQQDLNAELKEYELTVEDLVK